MLHGRSWMAESGHNEKMNKAKAMAPQSSWTERAGFGISRFVRRVCWPRGSRKPRYRRPAFAIAFDAMARDGSETSVPGDSIIGRLGRTGSVETGDMLVKEREGHALAARSEHGK